MMSNPRPQSAGSACIVEGEQPILTELHEPIGMRRCGEHDPDRETAEQFIRAVFKRTYGAELRAFYPNLLTFGAGARLRAALGYRDGMIQPLFSEQYLESPAHCVMGVHLNREVERRHLAEVGNLALAGRGEVRWVIAATTVFLHAAGYRWVLFTAVKSLYNAFRRLGLQPVQIAKPDPARLPEGGDHWGSYYRAGPVVCAGDIAAGYQKLSACAARRQPALEALLQDALRNGLAARAAGEIG